MEDSAHPTFVERFARNSYASEKVRVSEAQVVLIELSEDHLKKHEKELKAIGFTPIDATNNQWVAAANEHSRMMADKFAREVNDRPLPAYNGMRR